MDSLEKENRRLRSILEIAKILGSEIELDQLLQAIIRETSRAMEADRSSLFLLDEGRRELWSKVAQGVDEYEVIRFPMTLGIAGAAASTGETLNLPDAYEDSRFNREIDARTGYRTRSVLCMPIRNTAGKILGVIQVLNKKDGPFNREDEEFLRALSAQAAVSLENAALYQEIRDLFEAVVSTIITALDERDQATAGHSKRVALYTLKIAKAIHRASDGVFGSVRWTPEQLRRLRYAALLHDIGKIGIQEGVLNKSLRISQGRMAALAERFRRFRCAVDRNGNPELFYRGEIMTAPETILGVLESSLRFLRDINRPDRTHLEEGEKERLETLRLAWIRNESGEREPLLAEDEYLHLSVPRGNLTVEERDHIRSHVARSYHILSQIRWPEKLSGLPLMAASHHECLDGSGYPHHLTEERIPLESQIMAVADFYDALTARDRPYKPALSHEKSVKILREEAAKRKLNGEILRIFLESEAYRLTPEDYAAHGMAQWRPVEAGTGRGGA